jgi:hypothetical protein
MYRLMLTNGGFRLNFPQTVFSFYTYLGKCWRFSKAAKYEGEKFDERTRKIGRTQFFYNNEYQLDRRRRGKRLRSKNIPIGY